jgi:hypothetical protein
VRDAVLQLQGATSAMRAEMAEGQQALLAAASRANSSSGAAAPAAKTVAELEAQQQVGPAGCPCMAGWPGWRRWRAGRPDGWPPTRPATALQAPPTPLARRCLQAADPRAAIGDKLRAGAYEDAFQCCLARQDPALAAWTCAQLEPAQLLEREPCPLSHAVLVSLISQLSYDLSRCARRAAACLIARPAAHPAALRARHPGAGAWPCAGMRHASRT